MLACAGAVCCAGALARDARPPRHARAASTPVTSADLGPPPAAGFYAPAPPAESAVFRCGDSYSAQPCGTAPPIDVADPRTASQQAQARDVAARDKRLADWLAAQRRERDAAPPNSKTTHPPAAPACSHATAAPCLPVKPKTPHKLRKKAAKAASAVVQWAD